jgi:hypothetical protein
VDHKELVNDTIDAVRETDIREEKAGFDEVIDKPLSGSGWGFEVADTESLNLAEPSLLDLLSDEPVPGVVARGSSSPPLNHLPASSGGSMSKKLLRAQQFKF